MKLKRILFSLFVVATLAVMSIVAIKGNNVEAATGSADSAAQELLTKYYNGGVYTKQTVINVKDETTAEVKKLFHAGANALERTTYYNVDELWMTNDAGTINSGYGTGDGHTTHFQKDASGNNVVDYTVSGVKDGRNWSSMESAYVTLDDIKTSTGWETSGSAYVNTSAEVLDQFREFVAPMWLSGEATSNYVHFTKATIEQTSNGLVMKLYVDSTDSAKLTSADLVFAQATVTRGLYSVVINSTRYFVELNSENSDQNVKEEYMLNNISVSAGTTFKFYNHHLKVISVNKYEGNSASSKFVYKHSSLSIYLKFTTDSKITLYASYPDNVLRLDPSDNWSEANARFAAYFFVGSSYKWVSMADKNSDGVYDCEIPSGSWTNVIFCRMNPSVSTNDWNNKWNQSADLTLSKGLGKTFCPTEGWWNSMGDDCWK